MSYATKRTVTNSFHFESFLNTLSDFSGVELDSVVPLRTYSLSFLLTEIYTYLLSAILVILAFN